MKPGGFNSRCLGRTLRLMTLLVLVGLAFVIYLLVKKGDAAPRQMTTNERADAEIKRLESQGIYMFEYDAVVVQTLFIANFPKMVMTAKSVVVIEGQALLDRAQVKDYDLRRRDGPRWRWKYTFECYRDNEASFLESWEKSDVLKEKHQDAEAYKRHLKKWETVPEHIAPMLETAYQRYLHAPRAA
jgi:hypothetical protein